MRVNFFNESYGIDYLDYFQIKLPFQINVNFKSCDEANAFYDSQKSEIIICYELVEEYFLTRFRILELKDSL